MELADEVGDLACDFFHGVAVEGIAKVEEGSDVEAPDGGVCVVGSGGVLLFDDGAESSDEFGKLRWADGGIFDEADGFSAAWDGVHERFCGFSELPCVFDFGGCGVN